MFLQTLIQHQHKNQTKVSITMTKVIKPMIACMKMKSGKWEVVEFLDSPEIAMYYLDKFDMTVYEGINYNYNIV